MRAEFAATYLLVSAERHVPCGETEKRKTARAQKTTGCRKKSELVRHMFYDIVGKNYVEFPVKFIAAFTCIVANESAGHSVLGKKVLACSVRSFTMSTPVTSQPFSAKGSRFPPSPHPISRIFIPGRSLICFSRYGI